MLQKLVHLLMVLFIMSSYVFAVGETTMIFVGIDPSARSNGMAGAFTSVANDASGMFYNPAGLTNMKKGSFDLINYTKNVSSYMDSPFFSGSASYAFEPYGSFGLSYTNLNTHFYSYDELGYSSPAESNEWALTLGYGKKLTKTFSLGASVKYIHYDFSSEITVGNENYSSDASAYAFDFGLLFQNFMPQACLTDGSYDERSNKWFSHRSSRGPAIGFSILNMGPDVTYDGKDQSDPLPQLMRLGFSWNWIDFENFGHLISIDFQKPLVVGRGGGETDPFYKAWFTSWTENEIKDTAIAIGNEIYISPFIALRIGRFIEHKNYGDRNFWTYGLGLGPESVRFNISFRSYGDLFKDIETHMLCFVSIAF